MKIFFSKKIKSDPSLSDAERSSISLGDYLSPRPKKIRKSITSRELSLQAHTEIGTSGKCILHNIIDLSTVDVKIPSISDTIIFRFNICFGKQNLYRIDRTKDKFNEMMQIRSFLRNLLSKEKIFYSNIRNVKRNNYDVELYIHSEEYKNIRNIGQWLLVENLVCICSLDNASNSDSL